MNKLEQLRKIVEVLAGLGLGPSHVRLVLSGVQGLINLVVSRREEVTDADIISAMEGAFDANLKRDNDGV